jgi:hypothetical protein
MHKWDQPADSFNIGNKIWKINPETINNVNPVSAGYVIREKVIEASEELRVYASVTLTSMLPYRVCKSIICVRKSALGISSLIYVLFAEAEHTFHRVGGQRSI